MADKRDKTERRIVRVGPATTPEKEIKSWLWQGMMRGLKEREQTASAVSFRLLRAMGQHYVPGMYFCRMGNMAMGYAHAPRYVGDVGWDLVARERDKHLTPVEEARREELKQFIQEGGFPWPHPVTGEMGCWMGNGAPTYSFPEFVRAVFMNTNIFDAAPVRMEAGWGYDSEWSEVISKAIKRPEPIAAYIPVAGDRVRLTERETYSPTYRKKPADQIQYVVVGDADNQVRFELTWREMAYWVRNRDDREEMTHYGHSELEDLIDVLTGAITSFRWNVTQFTENHVPQAVISVPAADEQVIEQWLTNIEISSGPWGGWHQWPIVASGEDGKPQVSVTPLREQPADMQQERLITFCINVVGAVIGMNPEEIGFPGFNPRQGAPLQDADPETKIIAGQNTGFLTRMSWFESKYNRSIISRFDDGAWRFIWKGLGKSSEERNLKLAQQRLAMGLTSQDQEQAFADYNPRRMPGDLELWGKIMADLYQEFPNGDDDPETLLAVAQKKYVRAGGTWSVATSIPMGQAALALYMQEQQGKQGAAGTGLDDSGALEGAKVGEGQGKGEEEALEDVPDTSNLTAPSAEKEEEERGDHELGKGIDARGARVLEITIGE